MYTPINIYIYAQLRNNIHTQSKKKTKKAKHGKMKEKGEKINLHIINTQNYITSQIKYQ